jgi:hypothetical protein
MLDFFREGGWGMYPVLVFGLVALASAGRYAWDMESARLRFAVVMTVLVAVASIHAMLTDVAAVFSYVTDPANVADADLTRVVFQGLMESTRPGAMAGIFIVLALCLVAVGVQRDGQRQLRTA